MTDMKNTPDCPHGYTQTSACASCAQQRIMDMQDELIKSSKRELARCRIEKYELKEQVASLKAHIKATLEARLRHVQIHVDTAGFNDSLEQARKSLIVREDRDEPHSMTNEATRSELRSRHQPTESETDPKKQQCALWECGMEWPCDTAKALNGWEADLAFRIAELEEIENEFP